MLNNVFISFQDMPGGGASVALAYSGCQRGTEGNPCEGCHNPELWDFGDRESGKLARSRLEELLRELNNSGGADLIEGIVVIGGEPFDQDMSEVLGDIKSVRSGIGKKVKLVVYTGYGSLTEATGNFPGSPMEHPLVMEADYIKLGEYNPRILPRPGSALASGNQKMYRIERTEEPPTMKEVDF